MSAVEGFFEGVVWQISGWGAFVLLSLALIRGVVKGEIIPKSNHEEVRQDRDTYRELYYDLRDDYHEKEKTTWSTILAQGATTVALLESIHAQARGGSGEADDR